MAKGAAPTIGPVFTRTTPKPASPRPMPEPASPSPVPEPASQSPVPEPASQSPVPEPASPSSGPKRTSANWAQLNVYVPKDLRKRLRLRAVEDDRELSEIVTDALRSYLT